MPLLLVAAAVALLIGTVRREEAVARERVAFEDKALAVVRAVAEAQRRLHADTGTYGWVAALADAGLLKGLSTESRDGYLAVVSPRYRIDLLLPYGIAPGDMALIATRGKGHENVELERDHFAVIARPWGEALTGFRTFYLDEKNAIYVSEGVSDVASRSRRPLPDVMLALTPGLPQEAVGLRWWHLDTLPKR